MVKYLGLRFVALMEKKALVDLNVTPMINAVKTASGVAFIASLLVWQP